MTATLAPEISADELTPHVSAGEELPELTVKAILLGLFLAVVLGAANAYVGLRVGLTVSASIPAAVISMGVLRMFKNHNILENNIVQTIASAGESLAAGIIFTIPALVIAKYWTGVHLAETFVIGALGGTLGVLFTIPLRRAYIVDAKLPFPEGTACAEVLEVGEEGGGAGVKYLYGGIVTSALFSFSVLGARLWGDTVEWGRRVGTNAVAYFGTNLAPILIGVGYIVGLRISLMIFGGGALAWLVLIPLFLLFDPTTQAATASMDAITAANYTWSHDIRLIGGGAMITGGIYTLWKVRASLKNAFTTSVAGMKKTRDASGDVVAVEVKRTERDIGLGKVMIIAPVLLLGIGALYFTFTGNYASAITALVFAAIAGFFFSAVAGYMAGVVGSSNNPISGVTIVTLIFTALLLIGVSKLTGLTLDPAAGFAAALGVGAVIACAAAMAGDNLQDLKTGYLVGSTPWKQQVALVLGVIASAIVIAPVLGLLDQAYGIGCTNRATCLTAPQATLMFNILNGIFGGTLNWNLVFMGMALGVVLIAMRLPVMAVAVGVYLPFVLSVPILAGGLIVHGTERILKSKAPSLVEATPAREAEHKALTNRVNRNGLLFASGLIAGEAVMGVIMALLIVSKIEPMVFAPLFLGIFAAGFVAVFGEGKVRKPGLWAVALATLGAIGSLVLFLEGFTYTFQFAADVKWTGLLVLAYVAVLLFYLPLREVWAKAP
ncbi:MAG: OPT family oligopeptide transporter [Thermoplasmatota archaeon]